MKIKNRDAVWDTIIEVITGLLEEQGQEPGEITPATFLNADLGIGSVEAIHMMILIEDRIQAPLSFNDLAIRDGEYVQDLQMSDLHDFVCNTLRLPAAAAGVR